MPLNELSAGHIGRNGRAIETPPGSDTSDTGKRAAQLRTPNEVAQVALLPTPASIQSMLRNGTEVGDVGGFALNPNRRPPTSQRLSPSTLPSSVPSSASRRNYRYRGEAYLDPNEHNISHGIPPYPASRGMDDGSSTSFIYRNRSQSSSGTQPRGPSRGHNDENVRSHAMMHSSSASRSVPRYPSHINGHLRSQGDPRRMRPRSPFVYPTRLKRPGYRPSSPSLTEVYMSGSRSPIVMDRGTSFRTASPLSAYSAGRPHCWLQGANRSDPLPTDQQVPLGQSNNNGQYAEGFIRRPFDLPETYTRAPISTSAVSFDYPSSTAKKQQRTPSVPPLFYDYSEQFQQELDPSMTTAHNVSQALGTVSNGQIHYLSKLSQCLAPNKVASIDSSMAQSRKWKTRGSDQADHMATRAMSRAGSNDDVGFMAMESLDLEIKDTKGGSTVGGRGSCLKRSVSGLGSVDCSESMPQQPPDLMANHVVLRSNSWSQNLPAVAPRRAVIEPIEFRHDPSGSSYENRDSVHCFDGESRQFQADVGSAPHARRSLHSGRQLSEPDDDAPKFSFESERGYLKRLSRQSGHTVSSSFSRQRSPTVPLCESHEAKHSGIHAPVPRRSLSSPSNRDRFSGILSIEEGLNESDDITTVSKDRSGLSLSIASPDTRQSMLIGGRAPSDHQIAASRHISPKLHGIAEITISEPNVNAETSAASDCQCPSGMPRGAEAQDNMTVQQSPLTWGKALDVVTQGMKKTETHSFQSQTASIQYTPAMKLHSVPPSDTAEHGHCALTSQKVPLQTMKELPPLPRNSVVSVAPPESRNMGSLPFSFTALRHGDREETDSVTELGKLAASYLDHLDRVGTENPTSLLKDALEARLDENSSPTRPSSRPWNSEENYPWNNQKQQPEIALPVRVSPDVDALVLTKAPRFTLKLHRSSTSTTRAVKITKPRPSNESSVREQFSTRQRLSTSSDILQTTSFGRLRRPKPLINTSPGQNNSSRTTPTPLNTRFVESFDLPTHDFAIQTSPRLNLVPPSPGLNLEARSFFSDDSSQMQPKGSLRKRFSQLKATVTRASTSDDAKDGGRALHGSAVGKPWVNGRNSQQKERSQQVIRDSHPDDSTRWRFVGKVKTWFAHLVARKGHIEHGASTGIR